uniref:Gustatory receptor n=1 Tax=Stomoxys calcitrans TaxID=35570 RepID=A0A1I8NS67_STOCA
MTQEISCTFIGVSLVMRRLLGDLELKPFIWTLNALGLISCQYNDNHNGKKQFSRTQYHKIRSVAIVAFIQILCVSMFIYWLLYRDEFDIKAYNRTGHIYMNINFVFGCCVVSIIYLHFFLWQLFYMQLLATIMKHQRNFSVSRCHGWNLRHCFFLYSFLSITAVWNNYKAFEYTQLKLGAWTCYQVMYDVVFITCGIVVILFVAMTKILNCCLHHLNSEIYKLLTEAQSIQNSRHLGWLLAQRKNLLDLCQQKISDRFGLLIVLVVAFIVFSASSGPFYLISVTLKQKIDNSTAYVVNFLVTLYWNVPWMTIFVALLTCNVEEQARNTAKFLAKSCRSNDGMDKMIDKFLLKNLRQKPILTAYGFFSLDKSTLFKLFTTVFTYMVVLVQFKEMESTTKQLEKGS